MDIKDDYIDLNTPGAFTSASGYAKNSLNYRTPSTIRKKLSQIPAYRLHFPTPKRFRRRRVYVSGIDKQWTMDLLDMRKVYKSNFYKKYILVVVDVFSKHAWLEPLKSKNADNVLFAFKNVLKRSKRVCTLLQTDEGTEFYNKKMKKYLQEKSIKHFSTQSPTKCCIAERFIRTISNLIARYMTHFQTKRFIHKLKGFEYQYNNSYHNSIKMKPVDVNKDNEMQVWNNLYGKVLPKAKQHFNVGDVVLKIKRKSIFEKGHSNTFESESYIISKVKNTNPITYSISNQLGVKQKGSFYNQELFKVHV